MSKLETNLNILEKRDPDVFSRIFSNIKPSGELETLPSAAGDLTALYRGTYLHSPRNPVREAEKFVEKWNSPLPEILIMEGLGLGYHASAFLSAYPELIIWIIEPDLPFFLDIISRIDLRQILSNPRVILFFRPEPEVFASFAGNTGKKALGVVKIRSVFLKDQDYYKEIDSALEGVLSRKNINENTLKRFGRLWIRNLIKNMPLLPEAGGLYHLQDKFKDFPALVLAAGPSLEAMTPFLPELRKRFLIIGVDTALRSIQKAEIDPDFLVVVDPQYWNSRHIEGLDLSGTLLISDASTHPRNFRNHPGGLFLCGSHFPLSKYLEEATDIKGLLSPGGSVATCAWDAARYMGADEIFCGGLDLGFPDGQTHHRDSFFEKRALYQSSKFLPLESHSYMALNNAEPYRVRNNSGNQTMTDHRMTVYTCWFEGQMKKYPALNTYNLSSRGIAIEGMPWKAVDELLKYPPIRPDLDSILDQLKEKKIHRFPIKEFYTRINILEEEFKNTAKLSEKALVLINLIEGKYKKQISLEPELGELNVLDTDILSSSVRNMAGFLFQEIISEVTNSGKSSESSLENSRRMYAAIRDSSLFHQKLLSDAKKFLQ